MLVSPILSAYGGYGIDATKPSNTRSINATTVLVNVVHLSDNDVRFRTTKGTTVFIDPMTLAAEVKAPKTRSWNPNLILITHPHLDHYNIMVLRD